METPISSSKNRPQTPQNPNPNPNLNSSSPLRQWRSAAQRNVRNQWSNLISSKDRFFSASNEARNHATSLVNARLSQRYLLHMDLGDLKDMPAIREKAAEKLAIKQAHFSSCLLETFASSLREPGARACWHVFIRAELKGTADSLMFLSKPIYCEFSLKYLCRALSTIRPIAFGFHSRWLLVVELLNINYKEGDARANLLRWSHELYPGEYEDLRMNNMLSEENNQPLPPQIKNWQSGDPFTEQSNHTRSSDVLQVYLTTWLADVNTDTNRMREIFSTVEEEIQVNLS